MHGGTTACANLAGKGAYSGRTYRPRRRARTADRTSAVTPSLHDGHAGSADVLDSGRIRGMMPVVAGWLSKRRTGCTGLTQNRTPSPRRHQDITPTFEIARASTSSTRVRRGLDPWSRCRVGGLFDRSVSLRRRVTWLMLSPERCDGARREDGRRAVFRRRLRSPMDGRTLGIPCILTSFLGEDLVVPIVQRAGRECRPSTPCASDTQNPRKAHIRD